MKYHAASTHGDRASRKMKITRSQRQLDYDNDRELNDTSILTYETSNDSFGVWVISRSGEIKYHEKRLTVRPFADDKIFSYRDMCDAIDRTRGYLCADPLTAEEINHYIECRVYDHDTKMFEVDHGKFGWDDVYAYQYDACYGD